MKKAYIYGKSMFFSNSTHKHAFINHFCFCFNLKNIFFQDNVFFQYYLDTQYSLGHILRLYKLKSNKFDKN